MSADFWEALFAGELPPLQSLRPLALGTPISVGSRPYGAPPPVARVGNALALPWQQGGRGVDESVYGEVAPSVPFAEMTSADLYHNALRNMRVADSAKGNFDLIGALTGKGDGLVRHRNNNTIGRLIGDVGGGLLDAATFGVGGKLVRRGIGAAADTGVNNALAELANRPPSPESLGPYSGVEFGIPDAIFGYDPYDPSTGVGADEIDDPVGNWGGGPADIY